MAISVICSGCKKTLKVADTAAGKKIRCASCKAVVEVPVEEEFEQPEEEFETPDEETAVAEGPPKKKPAWEKDEAVSEGPPKKKPAWEKKKRKDDDDDDGYGVNKDEDEDDDEEDEEEERRRRKKKKKRPDYETDYDHDYREPRGRRRSRGQPHRGLLVMMLGLFTVITACLCPLICWILGGIVINMANEDLAKMESRVMDDSGQSMTTMGKVCAMIGVFLGVINAIAGIALRLSNKM